jgi:quercetin dioxygenase-like cupin family protein
MKIKPDSALPPLDAAFESELLKSLAPIEPAPSRAHAMRKAVMAGIQGAAVEEDFVTVHREEGEWRRIAPRVQEKVLLRTGGMRACLLRMEKGSSLPAHDHPSPEECVVLEGEVWLGDVFCRAGDFHRAPRGKPHGALRTDSGCLLYVRTGGGQGAALL